MATHMNVAPLFALLACAALASATQLKGRGAVMEEEIAANPVQKVVSLLEEMKKQVEKEAEQDLGGYEKYGCWCAANKDAKTQAVAAAEKRITQLEAFLEEVAGLLAQLTTEISSLEASIVEDQDALASATGIREKEAAEFHARENEAVETITTLEDALKVLAKVQLLQQRKGADSAVEIKPLLLQVHTVLKGIHMGAFRGVMQRDMWDLMGSLGDSSDGPEFLRPSGGRLAAIEQHGQFTVGQSPEGLAGHAAGASSYSARSGGIYGMLSQMRDEFEKTLAADRELEQQAAAAFQKLRSAKLAEISSAQGAKAEKKQRLAEAESKQAQSKEDLLATREALAADQQFLLGLEKNCKANEEDYAERAKARSEELVALAETIKILTTDDARDYFIKLTLLQTGSIRRGNAAGRGREAAQDKAQNRAVDVAMQGILRVARKQKNWALASLAVHVRLDAFAKVKEAMDKMTEELKAQQKEEVEKKDYCNQQVDATEDSIEAKSNEKEDLDGRRLGLENSIAELEADLQELRSEVAQMKESLKRASEDRSAENKIFQQAITDQRATAQILKKAKARLAKFYSTQPTSLAQGAAPAGHPVAAPPPKPQAYAKSAAAGGVLQLLDIILTDAAKEEAELLRSEQHAQAAYEGTVKDINTAISANEAAIADKSRLSSEAASGKSEAEAALLANAQDLTSLGETLKGVHLDCDYILKFFNVRQEGRQDELDAIAEAKAVLSGADFQ